MNKLVTSEVLARAAELDAKDELSSFRQEFCFPQVQRDGAVHDVVYLTGNSLGLMPKRVRDVVNAELDAWSRLGVEGHFAKPGASFSAPRSDVVGGGAGAGPAEPWFSYHELFRERGAALVGAKPIEVVAMGSLSSNLHLLLISFYRPSPTRHKIVIEAGAFPSDRYLVQSQVRLHGLDPSTSVVELAPRAGEVTLRTEDIEAYFAEHGHEVAVSLLSGVQYYTGQLFDIRAITAAAHKAGALVGWDLAHAVGNAPLQLHDDDVDFAAWCTYKYLNSGPGAVAMAFVHERHAHDVARPRLSGWWSTEPATRFQMKELRLAAGADGWQISNAPVMSMAPLHASLDVFARAGMDRLRHKSVALTGFLQTLLDQIDGVETLTPRDVKARGAQISLRHARIRAEDLLTALHHHGISVDYRRPDVIRVAPAPLYCSFTDAARFALVLADVVSAP
jgi:kynureninase